MPVFARHALGLRVEILLANAGVSRDAGRGRAIAANMFVRLTEITDKALVISEIDLLVAEKEHAMKGNGVAHFLHLCGVQRLGEIDVSDLGTDIR